MLKPQDLLITTRMLEAARRQELVTYPLLSRWTGLSASETHAGVKRAAESGLLAKRLEKNKDKFAWTPNFQSLEEFYFHGIKYVFPIVFGRIERGIPTGVSVPTLNEGPLGLVDGEDWVWPHPDGTMRGTAVTPLYRTVPTVALSDTAMHQSLAAIDLIRSNSHRMKRLGEMWLSNRFFAP